MNTTIKACLFGGAIFAAGIAEQAHAQCYRLGGPTGYALAGAAQGGWDWGTPPAPYTSYLDEFRTKLTEPNSFGGKIFAFPPVPIAVQPVDITYFNYNSLNTIDGLILPWINEPNLTSANDVQYIAFWFYDGGDLLIFADSSYTDSISSYLGVPTQDGSLGGVSNGAFPAFDGPFGPALDVSQSGSYGHLLEADVLAAGGRVIGRNAAGQVTVAFWDEGDFCPPCGAMVIATDVDMISSYGAAEYFPPNDNGRFALNLVAALLDAEPPSGADCDGNGVLNVDDLDCFTNSFLNGEL